MFTIFICNESTEVLLEGNHIIATYYCDNIWVPLINILKQKARRKQIIWHQDNASSHIAVFVREFLVDQNVIIVPQPAYSADLTSLDFCVFLQLKVSVTGVTFERVPGLPGAVNQRFKG